MYLLLSSGQVHLLLLGLYDCVWLWLCLFGYCCCLQFWVNLVKGFPQKKTNVLKIIETCFLYRSVFCTITFTGPIFFSFDIGHFSSLHASSAIMRKYKKIENSRRWDKKILKRPRRVIKASGSHRKKHGTTLRYCTNVPLSFCAKLELFPVVHWHKLFIITCLSVYC